MDENSKTKLSLSKVIATIKKTGAPYAARFDSNLHTTARQFGAWKGEGLAEIEVSIPERDSKWAKPIVEALLAIYDDVVPVRFELDGGRAKLSLNCEGQTQTVSYMLTKAAMWQEQVEINEKERQEREAKIAAEKNAAAKAVADERMAKARELNPNLSWVNLEGDFRSGVGRVDIKGLDNRTYYVVFAYELAKHIWPEDDREEFNLTLSYSSSKDDRGFRVNGCSTINDAAAIVEALLFFATHQR